MKKRKERKGKERVVNRGTVREWGVEQGRSNCTDRQPIALSE